MLMRRILVTVSVAFAVLLGATPPLAAQGEGPTPAVPGDVGIQLIEQAPGIDVIRPPTVSDEAENFTIDEAVGQRPDVFAGVTWTGGPQAREIYVKEGMDSAATTVLAEAGVSSDRYSLVEVPLSFEQLEANLLRAAEVLAGSGIEHTGVIPSPETGSLTVGAPEGSALVNALRSASDESLPQLLRQPLQELAALGVESVLIEDPFQWNSSLYDDATPNMGARITESTANFPDNRAEWCSLGFPIHLISTSVLRR